jgi:hypothetical protein
VCLVNVVMNIVTHSNCAAFNKSVEVAQGLTTFLNLVYLGLIGGWGTGGNKNVGTIKIIGTYGPECGMACLFGTKELNRQEILLTGLSAGM